MKVSKARPIRKHKKVEEEQEEDLDFKEENNIKKSEEHIIEKSIAYKIAGRIVNFLSKQKKMGERMRKEEAAKEIVINRLINRAEKILSSYGTAALKELEDLPEEAKDEIIEIISEFKTAVSRLKEKYRENILTTGSSEEILAWKEEMKEGIEELKNDYIGDVVEIFKKSNPEE